MTWLILMISAVLGLFGIGQRWSNTNSARDNANDPGAQLEAIQQHLTVINSRVEKIELRAG